MYSKTHSATLEGINAQIIEVELDSGGGMPGFNIVGLASKSISESKDRVRAALESSNYPLDAGKILVNLIPAHLPKEGSHFDLAIAATLMVNHGYINVAPQLLASCCFFGELSLNGKLKQIIGLLPLALQAQEAKIKHIVVPYDNRNEASLIKLASKSNSEIYAINNLFELQSLIEAIDRSNNEILEQYQVPVLDRTKLQSKTKPNRDLSEVIGQEQAKRGLEIAAAGGHHVLMIGPPGCGKSMLANRFIDLLPALSFDQALELTKIYSISGMSNGDLMLEPPLRAPHHSASNAALVGGGSKVKPGEVSLAHNGVLFLDELTEFNRHSIEQLRQILEDKSININRIRQSLRFPASFTLIAACNPCPCGYLGDTVKPCSCSPRQISNYIGRLSGPLLDRIDMHIELCRLDYDQIKLLNRRASGATLVKNSSLTDSCKTKIIKARQFAIKESKGLVLEQTELEFMDKAILNLDLSARSHQKILRLARTIANLDASEFMRIQHLAEALSFRSIDWERYRK